MYGIDTACRNGLVILASFITQRKYIVLDSIFILCKETGLYRSSQLEYDSLPCTVFMPYLLKNVAWIFSNMFIVGLLVGKNDPAIYSWSLLSQLVFCNH